MWVALRLVEVLPDGRDYVPRDGCMQFRIPPAPARIELRDEGGDEMNRAGLDGCELRGMGRAAAPWVAR
jgi:hypothetical protein